MDDGGPHDFDQLPGHEIIGAGLADLDRGDADTIPALVVAVGASRLKSVGLRLPHDLPADPERRLYARLSAEHGDAAHGEYNALIRRLVSFERAAERAARR